jgi:hypothetical protein
VPFLLGLERPSTAQYACVSLQADDESAPSHSQ